VFDPKDLEVHFLADLGNVLGTLDSLVSKL